MSGSRFPSRIPEGEPKPAHLGGEPFHFESEGMPSTRRKKLNIVII
jgi:hypothetical protein